MRKKDTNKGGNSFGSPMHVYLRIFLACVPTQLVKAFGIKRLNIYCLVRTVWPLQRQRSAPGVGGWVGMGGTLPYRAGGIPLYN